MSWRDVRDVLLSKKGLTVLLAVLAAFGVTVTLVDSDDNGTPDSITVTVNKQSGDGQPTKTLEVPKGAVERARPKLEAHLSDEGAAQHKKIVPVVGAVQGFSGCVTRILPNNFSSRNGAFALEQVLHYTVSPNRAGWSDVNAIVSLFSNPAREASSNFVIDTEGNCAYIVPIEAKAWTQAAGNPWSISYEIIATGSEPRYLEPAGMAKLKSVVHQVAARTKIPLRRGAVSSSCVPVRSGIVHHKDFGACGGGHVDITPFSVDAVVAALGRDQTLTDTELKIVKGVRHAAGTGHSHRYWCHRLGSQLFRIRDGSDHRRPARRRILKRVWIKECS